jgi:hypothetical protein
VWEGELAQSPVNQRIVTDEPGVTQNGLARWIKSGYEEFDGQEFTGPEAELKFYRFGDKGVRAIEVAESARWNSRRE